VSAPKLHLKTIRYIALNAKLSGARWTGKLVRRILEVIFHLVDELVFAVWARALPQIVAKSFHSSSLRHLHCMHDSHVSIA